MGISARTRRGYFGGWAMLWAGDGHQASNRRNRNIVTGLLGSGPVIAVACTTLHMSYTHTWEAFSSDRKG